MKMSKAEIIDRARLALEGKKPLSPWVAKRLSELALSKRTYSTTKTLEKNQVLVGCGGCYSPYVVEINLGRGNLTRLLGY
jgi:hypothetical protein